MPTAGYGVIFDVDGVLLDSYRAHFAAWQSMGRERGFTVSEAQFAASFGRTSREAMVDIYGLAHLTAAQIRDLDEAKEARYLEIIAAEFPEMDGAGALIDRLHAAGFKLGVGSSGPPGNVNLAVDLLQRRDKFAGIVHGREVQRGKPDPEIFLLAAQRMGLPAQRCCVIEDAPPGIEAAHRAGMACIALTSTGRTQAEQAAAEWVVASLHEVTVPRVQALIDHAGRSE